MLPRLLLHDGFFLDTRQRGERKIINSAWKPKDGKNALRIEIADKKDLVLVANFFNHHFTTNNDLRKALGATYEEMEQFSFDRAALALEKPRSYLVFDNDILVAANLRTFYTPNEYYKIFNGELFHTNPSFLIKDDYAEDIKAKGYSLNASRIDILNKTCISQIGKFLPSDVENLEFGIAIGVHPNYMRNGLTQYLIYEAAKSAKHFNCNYRFGIAVIDASYEATIKIVMSYSETIKKVMRATDCSAYEAEYALEFTKDLAAAIEFLCDDKENYSFTEKPQPQVINTIISDDLNINKAVAPKIFKLRSPETSYAAMCSAGLKPVSRVAEVVTLDVAAPTCTEQVRSKISVPKDFHVIPKHNKNSRWLHKVKVAEHSRNTNGLSSKNVHAKLHSGFSSFINRRQGKGRHAGMTLKEFGYFKNLFLRRK